MELGKRDLNAVCSTGRDGDVHPTPEPGTACRRSAGGAQLRVEHLTAYMYGHDARMEAAACAEMRAFHEDWPVDLGHVTCPVTLIHGAQDGNAPFATAQDYCALYPAWRLIEYPDEGQLVGYVRWRELFALLEEVAGAKGARDDDALRVSVSDEA